MKLRRLLMASALALSFTVSAPAVAKADPISAAIVTFIGFTGTAAAVATFVINTALYAVGSWALTKAASALGLIKNAVAERQASVTSLTLGESPRELVIGEACTGGTLVDAWNWGGKYGTDYVTRCIALADHEVDRLVGYYVDDQYYTFTSNGNQAAFNGALRLIFVNATANGSNPPADVGASNGGWTNADKVVGVTHVWVVTKIDDKVWTQGHPRLKFVLRGLKAFDPRFDPALGYTGPNPQTWDNPATHTFTRNAAVIRYNYERGIYATGRQGQDGYLLIGRGLSAEEAPPARIIAAANLCDEIVDGEARYTANGVISAGQTFIEVEEMFAAAMAGVIVQRDGGVEVEPGQAKAVVKTITDADLVAGEPVTFSNFLPDTDGGRINTVIPRYVEPAQGYKDHGGIIRRDPADLIEDGRPLEMTLPLMLVTSGKQADRCAEIARRKGRLERRASIVLPPDYAELEEGDWIAWTSTRYTNGATVRWQITSYSLGPDWCQHLTLEEIASSVYGVPDPAPDVTNPPPPPVPVDALELFGVIAEAVTLAGEDSAVPAVRFRWDPVDVAVVQIRAEVRKAGETAAASLVTDDVASGELVMTNGVTPDQLLECRLTPIAASSTRPVVPTNWFTVSTSTIRAGEAGEADNAGGLGGFPASELLSRLATTEAIGASNAAAVDDLEEVFGDTVSAAESALAAGQAAQLSQLKAGEAGDAATAANTSAGIASTKATEAGNSATAANASKVAAEAARTTADQKATAAVTSAAQAAASATDAGEAATASEGSATQAATRAGEALTYRNQASDARDGAVTAQIGAGVSASTAQLTAASLFPDSINSTGANYFRFTGLTQAAAAPENRANPSQFAPINIVNVAGVGFASRFQSAGYIGPQGVLRHGADRIYEVVADFYVSTPPTGNGGGQFVMEGMNADYSHYNGDNGAAITFPSGQTGRMRFTTRWKGTSNPANGTYSQWGGTPAWLRPAVQVNNFNGMVADFLGLTVREVSATVSAENSAAVATSQAASASAAASSASISADLAAKVVLVRGNLINNSTGVRGMEGWSGTGWNAATAADVAGPHFFANALPAGNLTTDYIDGIQGGQSYTLQADIRLAATGGTVRGLVEWFSATASLGFSPVAFTANAGRSFTPDAPLSGQLTSPSNATRARVLFNPQNITGLTSMAVRRTKLEWGTLPASGWTDDRTTQALSSQLSVTAAVAADAQTRLATAAFEVLAASGGDPAQLLVKTQGSTSLVQMVASALRFCNVVGGAVVDVMKLIGGSVYITGKLLLGAAGQIELDPAYPLILWKIGSARLAIGQLTNDGLIFWFGPNMPIANMRKNNAGIWMDTSGSSYFGGALSAGTLTNKASTSSLSTTASVETPRFNSNGGPITVVYSITGGWQRSYYSSTSISDQTQSGSVTVQLDRSVNGAAYQNNVSSFTAAYTVSRTNNGFEPGLGYLISETGGYSGSVTYTDPQQVAQDRQFRARITAFGPTSLGNAPTQQTLSIVAVEQ